MHRAGNATLALMWSVSGIVGIPVTDKSMDTRGPYGLPSVVSAVFTVATRWPAVGQVFTTHRRIRLAVRTRYAEQTRNVRVPMETKPWQTDWPRGASRDHIEVANGISG